MTGGALQYPIRSRHYAHLSPEFKNNEMAKLQLGLMNGNGSNGVARMFDNGSLPNLEKKVDSKVA